MTVNPPAGPPAGHPDDDAFWRRPEHPDQAGSAPPPTPTEPPAPYAGPPRGTPPPPGWRPPVVTRSSAPRELPAQDHEALDEAESSARTITYGIAMVAAAVLVIVVCLLCSRLLF